MDEPSNDITQLYQVNVVLWEGRHLTLKNANSKVVISIGKRKKTIYSKNNKTDCPYYNDFCIFPFRLPLSVLLDKILIIKVYQKSIISKLIGSFSVELATVWSQPNHQFYHKWAVFVDPKKPTSGTKGFIKCDIAVLAKGVTVKPTEEDGAAQNLDDNLLVPYGGTQDRLRTRIVLSVYRADSFSANFGRKLKLKRPFIKITYGTNVRKTSVAKNRKAPVWNEELSFPDLFPPLMQNIFIEICDKHTFYQKSLGNAAIDIRTLYEDGENGFLPTFGPNFLYLYQPLQESGRFKYCCPTENSFTYMGRLLLSLRTEVIDKFDKESLLKKKLKVGPKSIPPLIERMYFVYNKFILFAAIFDALLFDAKFARRKIKIQMTMGPKKKLDTLRIKGKKTKASSKKKSKAVKSEESQSSSEKAKRRKKRKLISKKKKLKLVKKKKRKLRATSGEKPKAAYEYEFEYPVSRTESKPAPEKTPNRAVEKKPEVTKRRNLAKILAKDQKMQVSVITSCDLTTPQATTKKDDYSYISFSGKFPCVTTFGEWPDSLNRMYCCNAIKKAIQNSTQEINKLKQDIQFQSQKRSEFSEKLKVALANLSETCERILRLTKALKLDQTNLSRERKKIYHKEIADIALKTKIASHQRALRAEDELSKISTYLAILKKYVQDPENSFPHIELWLRQSNRIVAQYRMKTEDIAFSDDFNYRGIMSGKTQTILFKGKKGKVKAKLDILMWFGLADKFDECLKILPDELNKSNPLCNSIPDFQVPSQLICNEKRKFQCRVHFFQGKIFFGFDNTGLTDAYVRVIFQGHNKRTSVHENTLSPIWDETLVFSLVHLYGPSKYLEENPPCITVELFDRDKLKSELIGRCFVKPIIKFKGEKYEHPKFPPKLKWEPVRSETREVGQILMAAELLELSSENLNSLDDKIPRKIPDNIRPHNVKYQLDILFWGVRPLKPKKNMKNKVFVVLECGESIVKSPILKNVRHTLNFPGTAQRVHLNLPKELEYAPSFCLKLFHIGSITHKANYVATCLVPNIKYLLLSQMTEAEIAEELTFHSAMTHEDEETNKRNWWKKILVPHDHRTVRKRRVKFFNIPCYCHNEPLLKFKCGPKCKFKNEPIFKFKRPSRPRFKYEWLINKKSKNQHQGIRCDSKTTEDDEEKSWWFKYHESYELLESDDPTIIPYLKIYEDELESQPEFNGFHDYLQNYDMVTGHEQKTKGGILMAKVKAVIKLREESKIQKDGSTEKGLLLTAFSNKTVKFVARVYIVCGKNLAGRDMYGKSDPYLFLQLGKHTISDKKHYAPKQLNPTFGKCFEFKGSFPRDYLLRIKVLDHDTDTKHDLIGETTIDLENRYYSKFHATCGIAVGYERSGFNKWRDISPPSEILSKLCDQLNLKAPIYKENEVVIEGHSFNTKNACRMERKVEIQSLIVLRNWHEMPLYGFHLVPEHVETRSLYHPSLPGIEQGKLVLWVDIFPANFAYMPPKVDIAPQPPIAMELRAIIWNVVDVVLDDRSFLFNSRLSDIYVKGWILSLEEEMQKTDVHYRSLNGEGNFNWRFIFHFNYIPVERRMIIKKKMNAFDLHPEERRVHCKLEIQVWDNDVFGDDFLGTLILELCSMPRGAKLPSRCTLKMLAPNAGKINLFKIKKTRGWWPFRRLKMKETIGNEFELTGKIDLELEILTQSEALYSPVGKGREEPGALPPPNRPDISTSRILNPLKIFRYVVLNRAKKWIFTIAIIVLIVLFFLIALYSFPNYLVKKLLKA